MAAIDPLHQFAIEKVVALPLNAPPEKVLEAARLGAHTRMPVYDGTPDNVVGIVNTKDLFFLFSTSGVVLLEDALYPATFLDPAEPVANAFRLFRKSHRPMAVVLLRPGGRGVGGDLGDHQHGPVQRPSRPDRPGARA